MSVSLPIQLTFTCKAHGALPKEDCEICSALRQFDTERVQVRKKEEELAQRMMQFMVNGKVMASKIQAAHEL